MIITYRYIKKQVDKSKQAKAAQTGVAEPSSSTSPDESLGTSALQTADSPFSPPQSQSNAGSRSLKWKIMLMAALAMPVFLETLDYTGLSCVISCIARHLDISWTSGRNRASSHRGMFSAFLDKLLYFNHSSTVCVQ